jgi:hypothetical protein
LTTTKEKGLFIPPINLKSEIATNKALVMPHTHNTRTHTHTRAYTAIDTF